MDLKNGNLPKMVTAPVGPDLEGLANWGRGTVGILKGWGPFELVAKSTGWLCSGVKRGVADVTEGGGAPGGGCWLLIFAKIHHFLSWLGFVYVLITDRKNWENIFIF